MTRLCHGAIRSLLPSGRSRIERKRITGNLREIISNSLAHRDYSRGYVAKMVIEKDRIFTENSNRTHGYGNLNLNTFEPFPKNPAISKVFREVGLADELGSGMRNTYKFTRLYSGGVPRFCPGLISGYVLQSGRVV